MRRAALLVLLLTMGCQQRAAPPVAAGPKSPRGWDVRYNAALALARRGSAKIQDPVAWESLTEMLNEEQQMRNFTVTRPDGREVPDETAARMTVIAALKAVQELHKRNPELKLTALNEPIARLATSANLPVRTEAKTTELALAGR